MTETIIQLLDGVERNAAHPNTFEIPSAEEKSLLRVGDFVKIGFTDTVLSKLDGCDTERMWVRVDFLGVDDQGEPEHRGTLSNDPMVIGELKCGDEVVFQPRHILSILPPDCPKFGG